MKAAKTTCWYILVLFVINIALLFLPSLRTSHTQTPITSLLPIISLLLHSFCCTCTFFLPALFLLTSRLVYPTVLFTSTLVCFKENLKKVHAQNLTLDFSLPKYIFLLHCRLINKYHLLIAKINLLKVIFDSSVVVTHSNFLIQGCSEFYKPYIQLKSSKMII